MSLEDNISKEEDVLWIPPGVEKQTDRYPFIGGPFLVSVIDLLPLLVNAKA
jgi:hypothetical protein